jgi:uroporphyrinogen-III synthase
MPRRILITRPYPDAAALAADITARGDIPLIAPLLTIHPLPFIAPTATGFQAVLATSANAFCGDALPPDLLSLPLYAVGDPTAAAAKAAGFTIVLSACGNGADLVQLLQTRLQPGAGSLLLLSGQTRTPHVEDSLAAAGFSLQVLETYRATPAESFPAEVETALRKGAVDTVLLYSPRTAAIFKSLCQALPANLTGVSAICISPATAAALDDLPQLVTITAPTPTGRAMLDLLLPHRFPIRVYYEDTDAGGIVYYANYLKFAERARTEMLLQIAGPAYANLLAKGGMIAVRDVTARYLLPAHLHDQLTVKTHLTALGGATMTLQQRIFCDATMLTDIAVTLVFVQKNDQQKGTRVLRMPNLLRQTLLPFVTPLPETTV